MESEELVDFMDRKRWLNPRIWMIKSVRVEESERRRERVGE